MAAPAACKICDTRRARRYCPGVSGDICPICCGTQREVTVNCPLDCAYLREARQRERVPEPDARDLPHKDLRITEDFLLANEKLLALAAGVVVQSALSTPAVVDFDVRAALASLIRTHETMQSGLYYDSRPTDLVAARLYDQMRSKLDTVREQATSTGESIREADLFKMLVFLQRLEYQNNNGRIKGRAFIDFLRQLFPGEPEKPESLLIHS